MTPAQETAIKQIEQLMREHFTAGLIVLVGDHTEGDEDHEEIVHYQYHGGYTHGIGLAHFARDRIMRDFARDCGREE